MKNFSAPREKDSRNRPEREKQTIDLASRRSQLGQTRYNLRTGSPNRSWRSSFRGRNHLLGGVTNPNRSEARNGRGLGGRTGSHSVHRHLQDKSFGPKPWVKEAVGKTAGIESQSKLLVVEPPESMMGRRKLERGGCSCKTEGREPLICKTAALSRKYDLGSGCQSGGAHIGFVGWH